MEADAFERAMQIADAFERESIPYAIGGALAFGIWGIPRGTVERSKDIVDLRAPRCRR